MRITGCPNGCARPYLAEIALIGRAPGRYTLRLGADAVGSRLNVAVSRQHRRGRPSSPRSMSSSAGTPPSGTRTNVSAISCGAPTCSSRRRARERAVASNYRSSARASVAAGAPRLTLAQQFAADTAAAERINDWLASVDAATRVRWALDESSGAVRAVVELRRAGGGVAASRRAGGSRHPGASSSTPAIYSPRPTSSSSSSSSSSSLNIQTFSSPQSVEEFEAQYGKLWEQGREGLDKYLELRKVEPMRRGARDARHRHVVRRACAAARPRAAPR